MKLYLHNDLKKNFSESMPLFDQVMALRGECFRHQDGRLTQRISLGGKNYFIKQHAGVGWKEIFKNILQGRWPIISAKNEWCAIEKLKSVGISVPAVVGYGQRGINPARLQSFILMEELAPSISLEDLCHHWKISTPELLFKRKLIKEVARIARTMHSVGMNHRDFYICHFLLGGNNHCHASPGMTMVLYLIDLHRTQIRKKTPLRWSIKDLAALYFSSKNSGLTQRDLLRFVREYRQKPLKEIFPTEYNYWQKVKKRGEQLYRDHNKQ